MGTSLLVDAANTEDTALLRSHATDALMRTVGCDECFVVPFDQGFTEAAPDYLRAFNDDAKLRHLLPILWARTGGRGAYIDTELLSERERASSLIHDRWLRPRGVTSQIVHLLTFGGNPLGVIHLNRLGRQKAFARGDLDLVGASAALIGTLLHAQRTLLQQRRRGAVLACLGARERAVAELATEGYENIQIAAHLSVSAHTVRNHLYSVFKKLGVYNRVDLSRALHPQLAGPTPWPTLFTHDVSSPHD